MNNLNAIILSLLAGISTLFGYLIIFVKKSRGDILSSSLGFTSGVMITISVIDLIPNSIKYLNILYMLFWAILGFVLSKILNKNSNNSINNNLKLYKLGIINMIVLVLHNIPEGIVTYISSLNNIKLGIILTIAIALHNIPEGISISVPIYISTKNKLKAFMYTFVSAMSEPLGAIITYLFLYKYIDNNVLGIIYSLIAGVMINLSYNLYMEAIVYEKRKAIIYFALGCIVMLLSNLVIG